MNLRVNNLFQRKKVTRDLYKSQKTNDLIFNSSDCVSNLTLGTKFFFDRLTVSLTAQRSTDRSQQGIKHHRLISSNGRVHHPDITQTLHDSHKVRGRPRPKGEEAGSYCSI